MAALEYLTANSLTAYPFRDRKRVLVSTIASIEDDWFYDIQFTSYVESLRSVYVSNITKTGSSGAAKLLITFNNFEDLGEVDTIEISGDSFVNHYKNLLKSFAYAHAPGVFSVKVILGPGLIQASNFSQNYSPEEAQLAPSAVVLRCPRVDTLTFKKYVAQAGLGGTTEYTITTVAAYNNLSTTPLVFPRHNTAFILEAESSGGLYVDPGLGAGLYNNCPSPGAITDVYTIATIEPDEYGALFLTATNCYSVNVLSENDAILLGANDPEGYLAKYREFQTNRVDVPIFDAVNPNHSLFLQNFCTPKCPAENLNAFAHYLNRVSDGAAELDRIATNNVETRGTGEGELSEEGAIVFVAKSFCDDTSFDRCSDPSNLSYITCGNAFVKYFHEFRTLQLKYDDTTVKNTFTVLEVIDSNTVRLDAVPSPTGSPIPFRLLDNGVISNMNCAIYDYNLTAETYTQPYFKVKYTTVESYNSEGTYVTLAAVNVAIFNPSKEAVNIAVSFEPTILELQDRFKIRTKDQVFVLDDPVVTIDCLQYAFIEAVYSIDCGVGGGQLSVSVHKQIGNNTVQIGDTYTLPPIDGLACKDTASGTTHTIRIAQALPNTYYHKITNSTSFSEAVLYGNKPEWLNYSYTGSSSEIDINVSGVPTENQNKRYSFSLRLNGGNSGGSISSLIVDYVANPSIIYPLAEDFTENSPLFYSKDITYTAENPILAIRATNMSILSNDFSDDLLNFKYTLTVMGGGTLPEGLVFNSATGKLYGKLIAFPDPPEMQVTLEARNASASALNPQTITLVAITTQEPEIDFLVAVPNNSYVIDNVSTYTAQSPIVGFSINDQFSSGFTLIGTLPIGLLFNNITGAITGKVREPSTGVANLQVYAKNKVGNSNTLSFNIAYTIYSSLLINNPPTGASFTINVDDETTEQTPLLTVLGTQIDGTTNNSVDCVADLTRIKYTAVGLPPGFTLGLCSGKIYGKYTGTITPPLNIYQPTIYANNQMGTAEATITLRIISSANFQIAFSSSAPNNTYNVYGSVNYTASQPLLSIVPTVTQNITYVVTGTLPSGLLFNYTTGKITGRLQEISQGSSTLQVYAISPTGRSNTLNFTITYIPHIAVSISSPVSDASFTINATDEFTEQSPLLVVSGVQIDGTTNNSVDCVADLTRIKYTAVGLPPGFTLGLCSGKIYGRYTGSTSTANTAFPTAITASNLTGTATTNITINISSSFAFEISFN